VILEGHWAGPPREEFVELVECKKFLSGLREEAIFRATTIHECP